MGVIVCKSLVAALSRSPAMMEPVAVAQCLHDEIESLDRGRNPFRFAEDSARMRERRNHQAVPIREYLVIAQWRGPSRPYGQKKLALLPQQRLVRIGQRKSEPPETV